MRGKIIRLLAIVSVLAALVPASMAGASEDGSETGSEAGELQGVVEALPGTTNLVGDWLVSGVTVHVTTATEIDDDLAAVAVGATVEVEGVWEADGSITAHEVEVSEDAEDDDYGEMKLEGLVDALPPTPDLVGDWVVSGVTVHVTTETEIETEHGSIAVGSAVEVEGLAEADGSITAHRIETKDPEDIDEHEAVLLGTVGSFPSGDLVGKWRVSRHVVRVAPDTTIRRARLLDRGASVRVVGTLRANGTIRATRVAVRAG